MTRLRSCDLTAVSQCIIRYHYGDPWRICRENVSVPDSVLNFAVRNVFDTYYVNTSASATRGADVPGLGRQVALSYQITF